MPVPDRPKIYHIVHVDNLSSIVADGCLWSDAVMIKADRLRLPVDCHDGTYVGDYVPFYLCPRSVMLYVISKRNHPNVTYKDGQGPVLHLVSDMYEVVEWAKSQRRKWALTDINAANRAADFYCDLAKLDKLNWDAIKASNWVSCRDHKMAEFLMHKSFPWELVNKIGVYSERTGVRAMAAFGKSNHRPQVKVKQEWYY
jgi:ssDNA thymidine ADP-ribosyltransferase, DarT